MSVATRSMGAATRRWMIGVLRADAAIVALLPDGVNGIFGGDPKHGAQRPYAVVQVQAVPAPYRAADGPYRLWTKARMLVKFVGEPEQFDTLDELRNRADVHFEGAKFQPITPSEGGDADVMMVVCTRDAEFDPIADELGGELTEQCGFFYAVAAQELGQT